MPVTVNVNGRSLVHRASGGTAASSAPDVCKTPCPAGGTPPIPYPNTASSATLVSGSMRVRSDLGFDIAIKGSEFPTSVGDNPGVAGGVKSGSNMNKATWVTHSFTVKIEGKAACRLGDTMQLNDGNTVCAGIVQQPVI